MKSSPTTRSTSARSTRPLTACCAWCWNWTERSSSASIRTSANNVAGYVGLRTATGQVLGEARFTSLGAYTPLEVTANAGTHTSLVVFAGLWASGDTWLQLDDVSVVGL